MKNRPELTLDVIAGLKKKALLGDRQSAVSLLNIANEATRALHVLAFYSGPIASELIKDIASTERSWPAQINAIKETRLEEYDPIRHIEMIDLGTRTGLKLNPCTRPRKLDLTDPSGWALWIMDELEKAGKSISTNEALRLLAESWSGRTMTNNSKVSEFIKTIDISARKTTGIQIIPSSVWERASKPKQSLESAIREVFDQAIASLRE